MKKIFFKLSIIITWALIVIYVITGYISDHPLRRTQKERTHLILLSPQGWGFFTRDPREPVEYIYQKKDDEWVRIKNNNFMISSLFGAKRTSRALGVELQPIMIRIPDTNWVSCNEEIFKCIENNNVTVDTLDNRSLLRNVCGHYMKVHQEPVPWAWSKFIDSLIMPSQFVQFYVKCD